METQLPIIKNFDDLATSKIKKDALDILEIGYESIIVDRLIRSKITIENNNICVKDKKICLDDYEKVFLIAVGKCAVSSAKTFEELLGDGISAGIVLDVKEGKFKNMISEVGTHPFPSEQNVFTTKSIADILKDSGKKDLILTIISGGGSSLMCLPNKITCEEQKNITDGLMRKGATISELNTVRKHTSQIKGGQFSKMAYPSTVVSFILSDVPGDDLSVIASGPTVKDETTVKDAEKILEKYELEGWKKYLIETPKKDKYFEKTTNILLGSNLVALKEMKKKAEELGYNTYIEDTKLEGGAREFGKKLASKDYLPMSCHIWGGETTVKILGGGKGGRNQEFVLGALPYLSQNMVVVAAASDGWDNSNRAGAIG
ncbi:glycerate kinase, partial [Patescibacteria group bacterium]